MGDRRLAEGTGYCFSPDGDEVFFVETVDNLRRKSGCIVGTSCSRCGQIFHSPLPVEYQGVRGNIWKKFFPSNGTLSTGGETHLYIYGVPHCMMHIEDEMYNILELGTVYNLSVPLCETGESGPYLTDVYEDIEYSYANHLAFEVRLFVPMNIIAKYNAMLASESGSVVTSSSEVLVERVDEDVYISTDDDVSTCEFGCKCVVCTDELGVVDYSKIDVDVDDGTVTGTVLVRSEVGNYELCVNTSSGIGTQFHRTYVVDINYIAVCIRIWDRTYDGFKDSKQTLLLDIPNPYIPNLLHPDMLTSCNLCVKRAEGGFCHMLPSAYDVHKWYQSSDAMIKSKVKSFELLGESFLRFILAMQCFHSGFTAEESNIFMGKFSSVKLSTAFLMVNSDHFRYPTNIKPIRLFRFILGYRACQNVGAAHKLFYAVIPYCVLGRKGECVSRYSLLSGISKDPSSYGVRTAAYAGGHLLRFFLTFSCVALGCESEKIVEYVTRFISIHALAPNTIRGQGLSKIRADCIRARLLLEFLSDPRSLPVYASSVGVATNELWDVWRSLK